MEKKGRCNYCRQVKEVAVFTRGLRYCYEHKDKAPKAGEFEEYLNEKLSYIDENNRTYRETNGMNIFGRSK